MRCVQLGFWTHLVSAVEPVSPHHARPWQSEASRARAIGSDREFLLDTSYGRRISVLDGVTIGSVLSCRGISRLGSSLTVRSVTRLGGETSIFDSSNTFSCVSVRSSVRLGSSLRDGKDS